MVNDQTDGLGERTETDAVLATDHRRWADLNNFPSGRTYRSEFMASLVVPGSSVLELGAGRRLLEEMLPAGCQYTPSDLVSRGPGSFVCDLNEAALPEFPTADVVVVSGVIEYVNDIPALLETLRRSAKELLVSYVSIDFAPDPTYRRDHDWRHHLSSDEFSSLFGDCGFSEVERFDIDTQAVFRFRKEPVPEDADALAGPTTNDILRQVRAQNLTYLSPAKLGVLVAASVEVEATVEPDAIFVEAGCALGGSAILLTNMKSSTRRLQLFDTFSGIPAPGENDDQAAHKRYEFIASGESHGLGEDQYYGYEEDLASKVRGNFKRLGFDPNEHGVEFIAGDVRETYSADGPQVAFAHFDVDWHDATLHLLRSTWLRLAAGGRIVVDDYGFWGGCKTAVDKFHNEEPSSWLADTGLGSVVIGRSEAFRTG